VREFIGAIGFPRDNLRIAGDEVRRIVGGVVPEDIDSGAARCKVVVDAGGEQSGFVLDGI